MSTAATYILGTHNEELERLGFQHRVWADDAHELWRRANIGRGQSVLDLGCGPGFASFDLADIVGHEGSIIGVDRSKEYIRYALDRTKNTHISNTSFICSDFASMHLGSEQFDAAYARWVFSWVRDVDHVIAKVAASLKPGGVFAVQEYIQWGTFRFVPEHPDLRAMIEACRESWRLMDSEIDIGRTLSERFEKFGLKITHVAPLERTARSNSLTWQWPTEFLKIYAKQLITLGLLTEVQLDRYLAVLPEIEKNNSAFLVTPLMIEIIGEKSA
ncbi:MAG: methyltransferase domain-containing protein [Cryomorphaceae bacterium]